MKYGRNSDMLTAQESLEKKTLCTYATRNSGSAAPPQLIVEFVGPPGSGKTTNCSHFSDLLNRSGINAHVFKDVKQFLYQLGIFQRFLLYGRTILFNSDRLLSYILLLTTSGIFSLDSVKRYIKLCIFNTAAREFMNTHRVDVLLLDQWIIQGLWSATIFRARSYVSLQQKLPEFYFPTSYVLYFDVDEETACDRIEARNSDTSRFDQMDRERRLTEMKRYNDYLRTLYENSGCSNKLRFSTKEDPQIHAKAFLKVIQSTFQIKN